ncbi:MAG: PEP-utilizing enzyme [Acidimicrobiia bacterium]
MLDLEPGDVIVARVTHSNHNTVFPIAGAVATHLDGLLGHTAVLARELGLPAVVGVRGLLDRVKTGDIVEVDPVAGVIRMIQE